MLCEIHHSEMVWKEGVSKTTGKAYAFWGCAQKMPDGSWCQFKPPRDNTPVGKFTQSLDESGARMDQTKKDELITRTAIIKELIARGDKVSLETVNEFRKWVELAQGKGMYGDQNKQEGTVR